LSDASAQLQRAGVLLDLTSTSQTDSTGSNVAVAGFTGSVTLTESRRVHLVLAGNVLGTAAGNLVTVTCTFGGASVKAQNYISAAGGPGAVDTYATGVAFVLAAGTYSITSAVLRTSTAGTGSLVIGARLQVIDIGPA
jgi:hypothetical protein